MIVWSEVLRCPECGASLDPRPTGHETGWLACRSHRFPFVSNIPIFIGADVARWVEAGEGHAATTALLAKSANRGVVGRIRNLLGLEPRDPATFEEGARLLLTARAADYFLSRMKQDSYEVGRRFAESLTARPVVDLGCGAGHLTRLFGSEVVGCDNQFALLFLARRFVASDASYVCCDLSRPLPFRDGSFASAFSCDSFNYVADRKGLGLEIRRIARSAALLWLHTKPTDAVAPPPLSLEDYRSLFPGSRLEWVSEAIANVLLESPSG